MPTHFSCAIDSDSDGTPQMSVNPQCINPAFSVIGNTIVHAFSRAMQPQNPRRLHFGLLVPGQSDIEDGGPLQSLWLAINHQVFTRLVNECLAGRNAHALAQLVTREMTFDELLQALAECSSIPRSFLVPNLEYIEAVRDYCHHHEKQLAPRQFLVGISYLIGRVKERGR